eukprot:UN04723
MIQIIKENKKRKTVGSKMGMEMQDLYEVNVENESSLGPDEINFHYFMILSIYFMTIVQKINNVKLCLLKLLGGMEVETMKTHCCLMNKKFTLTKSHLGILFISKSKECIHLRSLLFPFFG